MGVITSIEICENYLKIALKNPYILTPHSKLKMIPFTQEPNISFFLCLCKDLFEDKEFQSHLNNCIHKYTENTSSNQLSIYGLGSGFQVYKENLKKILESTFTTVNITKVKHGKNLARCVQNYSLGLSQPFFQLEVPTIVDLLKLNEKSPAEKIPISITQSDYPVLVVSIKSGSLFYLLSSPTSEPIKISQSIFGEATLAGLQKLCGIPGKTLDEAIEQSFINGNALKSNLTVGDIYANQSELIKLPKEIIASSLGKDKNILEKECTPEDKMKGFILMLGINLSNLAGLLSTIHEAKTVVYITNQITVPYFNSILSCTASWFVKNKTPCKKMLFSENSPFLSLIGSIQVAASLSQLYKFLRAPAFVIQISITFEHNILYHSI